MGCSATCRLRGKGPVPDDSEDYRAHTLDQVNELRELSEIKPTTRSRFCLIGAGGTDPGLGVINFKGGSAKTTTTAHLAQYLALQGYRCWRLISHPQASLAMFGVQPETEVGSDETIYAAVKYGDDRRPMREVIEDVFPGRRPGAVKHRTAGVRDRDAVRRRRAKATKDSFFFERLRLAIAEVELNTTLLSLEHGPYLGFMTLSAVYAVTGLIVSVHPGMLDVLSMSQFLIMLDGLVGTIRTPVETNWSAEFFQYVITRHDPNDQAQAQVVLPLRHLFAEDAPTPTAVDSTAIELAGTCKENSLLSLRRAVSGVEVVVRAIPQWND